MPCWQSLRREYYLGLGEGRQGWSEQPRAAHGLGVRPDGIGKIISQRPIFSCSPRHDMKLPVEAGVPAEPSAASCNRRQDLELPNRYFRERKNCKLLRL